MARLPTKPVSEALRDARNRRQRAYHARLRASEVKPFVLVGPTVMHALLASGRLQEAQAEDRKAVGEAVASALADWAERCGTD
jgi:hypothetical protein